MADITYLAGLDLGQSSDFTALAVLERTRPAEQWESWEEPSVRQTWWGIETVPTPPAAPKRERTYALRHLERFQLDLDRSDLLAKALVFDQRGVTGSLGGGKLLDPPNALLR